MEYLMKSSRLIVMSRTIQRRVAVPIPRMGSFNSAPKIDNIDSQDDGLEVPKGLNTNELLQHFKHLRGIQSPQLLNRYFSKPTLNSGISVGLRCLNLDSDAKASFKTPSNQIRLLQWNILSQTLGQNNDGFICCPEEALVWENRKYLIVQEILQTNPDIICLQEVDHYKFLQSILGSQNYEGKFFPKPDSPCLYVEQNNGPDGCAIFYKRNKFELQKIGTRVLEVWRVQTNQVVIALNLLIKDINKEICVCTTHLKARHGSLLSKLRNEQGRYLLKYISNFAENRPILLCGDFNAEPDEPVYSTVLKCDLNLSSAYADANQEFNLANCIEKKVENGENNIDFEDDVQRSIKNEPAYTTWKIREGGEECHTIDYIFYSKKQFKVKNCLDFPPGEEIGINRTPSWQYPSDHFSLVCDFEIVEEDQKK